MTAPAPEPAGRGSAIDTAFATKTRRLPSLLWVALVPVVSLAAADAHAQAYGDLQPSAEPLVLEAKGSFYIGGDKAEMSHDELGRLGLPGPVTVGQMYVEYMVPAGETRVPVVLVHGATLSGKSYDTTPDGRTGWAEHFVRRGHPVYVPDQVGRARSGFDQAVYNRVKTGATAAEEQPPMLRLSDTEIWSNFRFGPSPGVPFDDTRFPLAALDELSRQAVPDLNASLPAANPTWQALSALATTLDGAILLGHSQSGRFPLEVATSIGGDGIRGMVLVEPGRLGCKATVFDDRQIATLAGIPILAVFGDHLETPNGTGLSWKESYDDCLALIERVNGAGGDAAMLYPPDRGVFGNSHMLMQDDNSLEIADMILEWIERRSD